MFFGRTFLNVTARFWRRLSPISLQFDIFRADSETNKWPVTSFFPRHGGKNPRRSSPCELHCGFPFKWMRCRMKSDFDAESAAKSDVWTHPKISFTHVLWPFWLTKRHLKLHVLFFVLRVFFKCLSVVFLQNKVCRLFSVPFFYWSNVSEIK